MVVQVHGFWLNGLMDIVGQFHLINLMQARRPAAQPPPALHPRLGTKQCLVANTSTEMRSHLNELNKGHTGSEVRLGTVLRAACGLGARSNGRQQAAQRVRLRHRCSPYMSSRLPPVCAHAEGPAV